MILERENMDVTEQAHAAGIDCESATLVPDGTITYGDEASFTEGPWAGDEEGMTILNLFQHRQVAIVYRRGRRVAVLPMARTLAEQEPLERLIDLSRDTAALL